MEQHILVRARTLLKIQWLTSRLQVGLYIGSGAASAAVMLSDKVDYVRSTVQDSL